MLNVVLKGYSRPCGVTTGGVARVWVFDPQDFSFTQAAPSNGDAQVYSAVAIRTTAGASAASGALMFPIVFQEEEAEYKFTHTRQGSSVKYSHELSVQLPQLSQSLTTFLERMDKGGVCGGLGLIIEMNDGKIFVMGEAWVGTSSITPFRVRMEGTEGTSGKTYDNFSGANAKFIGNYFRPLYEYSGGADSIIDLETA